MIDFTNCRVIPGRAYNGANGSKIAVGYNCEAYSLLLPRGSRTDTDNVKLDILTLGIA